MNAKNSSIVKASLALTSLVVCGAFAIFATSCASSSDNGGGGSSGGGTPAGGSGGGSIGPTGGSVAPGGNSVTFVSGQAQGALTGYGWVAMGPSGDTVSDPVCNPTATKGGATQPITNATPCPTTGQTVWNSASALCITGLVPALGTPPDYTGNWGIEIGVNVNSDPTIAIGAGAAAYTSINVAVSNPATGLRVNIHRQGDPDNTPYCATYTGSAIPLTTFNTTCWTPTTAGAFAPADAVKIDKVMIQVPSTTSAITVTNMCLTGITFN